MDQDGHKYRLPKLASDGANWVVYRDRVIWAMQGSSIDEHIAADTPSAAYTALGTLDGLASEARWTKEESTIKQVLCSTLPDSAFTRIKGAASVKAAWDILKRVYEERSKALVADIVRRFRNKRCEDDESVRTHFESLADLREQLGAMGKAVADDDYADTLLASLPSTYDSTVSSISASARLGSKTLTAEIFEQLIIDEYERRQVKDKRKDTKDEALTADSSKKGGKSKPRDKRTVECFNCHKKGHYRSECRGKGGGNEGGTSKQGKGAKEDATQAEEKDEPEAWAAIEEMAGPADAATSGVTAAAVGGIPVQAEQSTPSRTCELYDSGATRHMTPSRDRLKSYRTIPPRAIAAADKRTFYAVGTGDLEIEVPNGTSRTPIILKDVLHAPDMGLTIVSISRITKAGYSVTFKDNTCQI
jgi:hypothetical protein